jgi:hypothetical protein
MPPAILASARARPRPLMLARRVSPDAPRAAPRLPARLPARRPVEPIAVRGAPLVRVDGVRGVRRRGSRIVSRAASAGGLWRLWPFAHAWAVDAPTIEADAAGDSPGADQQQQQQQQQHRGDATNPWRTVALVLGAMLVAALVHPPLASASSTLIAAVAANVVAPVGVLYPAATYIAAGAQAWANNAVGVVGTLVSSAASAGAGYAAASARARAEMEELRAEIAGIREAAAAVGISAAAAVGNPAIGISAAVGMSVSNTRPAIAEETRGAVVPTEDPVVAAERASAEAELADLRRQLARLRAVWTPGDDDEGDEGNDAGDWGVAGDAEGVSKRDGGDGVTRVSSTAAAAGSVDARAAGVSDWRATAKSRALWSPSDDDDDDAEAAASSPASAASSPASSSSSSSSFHSSSAIDEEEAARIAAEIVALRAELAGVRGVGASSGAVPGAGSGDFGGVRSVAEASGPVDWAALAKSRALWSPSDDDDGDDDDGGDAGSARGESRASAVDGFGETGERARLLEEDVAWRRRLGMTENAQNDQPLGH